MGMLDMVCLFVSDEDMGGGGGDELFTRPRNKGGEKGQGLMMMLIIHEDEGGLRRRGKRWITHHKRAIPHLAMQEASKSLSMTGMNNCD